MPPSSGDDQLLSLRALSRRVGVAEGTLRNWATRQDRPLRVLREGERVVSSTVADVRAFCAAHHDLSGARRATAHLDNPTATVDLESLRAVLEAVITVVRATAGAHVELADSTADTYRTHSATLTGALRRLDAALTGTTAATPPGEAAPRRRRQPDTPGR